MRSLKALISGMFLPSLIVPIVLSLAYFWGKPAMLSIPFFHVIPLMWGIWNVLYFAIFKSIIPGSETIKLLVTGAVLGLIVALIGIYWVHLPTILGFTKNMQYIPLIGAPIVYAILWWLVVHPLNKVVGLK